MLVHAPWQPVPSVPHRAGTMAREPADRQAREAGQDMRNQRSRTGAWKILGLVLAVALALGALPAGAGADASPSPGSTPGTGGPLRPATTRQLLDGASLPTGGTGTHAHAVHERAVLAQAVPIR